MGYGPLKGSASVNAGAVTCLILQSQTQWCDVLLFVYLFFFWGGGVAGVFSHIHWQVSSGKLKLGINDCLNKAGKLEETDERRDIPECLEMCCRA